ncbi:MAG: 50S ribosomal protein L9 [Chloroflexota bacterium]|nr:50S ribosomal protein L9 [Dehalococcoidia bacterium]MDW8254657.1 50S ribosomal protein L9 [Chloroflexota bacterium]
MKVLFLKEVENVAQPGEVKDVADGFARNYLLPKGLAVAASSAMLKQHAAAIEQEKKRAAKESEELRALAARLSETTVTIPARAGVEGRLYGSITAADIAEALHRQHGVTVDRRLIELDEPIRRLGEHQVTIRLRRDLLPTLKVVIVSLETASTSA